MKRVVVFAALLAALGACDRAPPSGDRPGGAPGGPATVHPAGSGSAGSSGSAAGSGSAVAPARTPIARPLLWAVEKAGRTTYFFGTMHVGIDAATQLPPIVWATLHGAPVFAMEANLEDPHIAEMIKPTDSSLHAALGEAYWKQLEDALGATVAAAVDKMPPMIPATLLTLKGLPPTLPMDKALATRATDEHKPIVFLEPAARQIELLGKWMDIKAIKLILDELPDAQQRAHAMLEAYAAGDERQIIATNDADRIDALHHGYTKAEYDREMTDLLYDRNASWIPELEQLHAAGGGFVAVGALHLIGPRSVLDLLAHKGYKVTRLAP